jgi:hypothetical protein
LLAIEESRVAIPIDDEPAALERWSRKLAVTLLAGEGEETPRGLDCSRSLRRRERCGVVLCTVLEKEESPELSRRLSTFSSSGRLKVRGSPAVLASPHRPAAGAGAGVGCSDASVYRVADSRSAVSQLARADCGIKELVGFGQVRLHLGGSGGPGVRLAAGGH